MLKKKKPLNFSQIAEEDDALDALFAPHMESPQMPDALYDRKLASAELGAAIALLPQNYQTVLNMRYGGDLKFREIAAELHEPIDTVKSKHRRGLMMLRKFIRKH